MFNQVFNNPICHKSATANHFLDTKNESGRGFLPHFAFRLFQASLRGFKSFARFFQRHHDGGGNGFFFRF